ncbi:hypothetical protein [Variovorax sp. PCZ-1]|uniref:tetratricopeptide repeat protein n=1 Tax=Variovorax sp. PCZ-1 TaxID=2835533 RepID=UPI001BCF52E5|nr:hypothetical protein [Variovorax sp. PCZ-1]MBS7807153.1 hypothetical protein [Variovorax sp. PCZ-1]
MTISWERRVVPQWTKSTEPNNRFVRNPITAFSRPTTPIRSADNHEFEKVVAEFELHPSIGLAADALRFGLLNIDSSKLKSIATFILKNDSAMPAGIRRLADSVQSGDLSEVSLTGPLDHKKTLRDGIHDTRRWLVRFPNDALTWLDLGRLHAAAGNTGSAKNAVQTALALSPSNRTILRGTSRFFLHAHDPAAALAILDKSPRTERDPWLIAGHIAINSILGKSSKFTKKARAIISAGSHSPYEISELASSLATLELEAGQNKQAKRLYNISLSEPNENALAQVQWAAKQLNLNPDLPDEWLQKPMTAEAGYYHFLMNDQFEDALMSALTWHIDEPFAARPMLSASFIAAIFGDLNDARSYARQGLITEPDNLMLLNNLAFATGAEGDIEAAETVLKKISSIEKSNINAHTVANLGMLAYLRQELEIGMQLYDTAIEIYRKQHNLEQAAIASIFHWFFSHKVASSKSNEILDKARKVVEESRSRFAQGIFVRITKMHATNTAPPVRQIAPRKWHYDREKNLLIFDKHLPLGKS